MSRATPVDRTVSVLNVCSCSNQSLAAVMLRATPSEVQFSAEYNQASSLVVGGKWRGKNPRPFFILFLTTLFLFIFGRSGGR